MIKFNSKVFLNLNLPFQKSKLNVKKLFFLISSVQQRKKDSKWIYSSKYDQMQSMKKGRIFITTQTGNDSHDVTMRMYQALIKDSIAVFSYNPDKTKSLLKALSKKDRFIDPSLHAVNNQNQIKNISSIIPKQNIQNNVISYDLSQKQQKSFQQLIQVAKYVDMQIDIQSIMKKNNDPGNVNLVKKQKQLKKYLKNRQFRSQLQKLKNQTGYPQVLPLLSETQDIKYLYQNGIDVTYVLSQYQIQKSKQLITVLEKLKFPYQILPCKNQLINAIVASGFPADRFSIQYFPNNIQQILIRRKKQKLTIALVIKKNELQKVIQQISSIYGKQHLIFMQNQKNPFRSQIHNFYDYLKQNIIPECVENVKVIISPFISQFNSILLQQQHKIRHIYGQAQNQKTNFIDLQILNNKLAQLKKKQTTHQIDIYNMTAQLLQRFKDQNLVKNILRKMLSLGEKQLSKLIIQGQSRIKVDYLGLKQFQKNTRKKQKQIQKQNI